MAATLFKLVMLLVSINLLLYVGGIRVIGDDASSMVNNFIKEESVVDGQVIVSSSLIEVLPTSFERSGSDVLNFIDSIAAIGTFMLFMVNIVFTPLGLFTAAGMPVPITLMVGMPLMIGMLLAVASFLRSGS